MFALAWTFTNLHPGPLAATLIDLHRSLGILVLLAGLVRIAWRLSHPLPPLPPTCSRAETLVARAVQACLYLVALAMPVLGWLASNAAGDSVRVFGLVGLPDLLATNEDLGDLLFSIHETLSYVLLVLLALHVAGALRHHFIRRDDVLRRMLGTAASAGQGRL